MIDLFRWSVDHLSLAAIHDLIASGPSYSCVRIHLLKYFELVAECLHFLINLVLVEFREGGWVRVFGGLWGGLWLVILIIGVA